MYVMFQPPGKYFQLKNLKERMWSRTNEVVQSLFTQVLLSIVFNGSSSFPGWCSHSFKRATILCLTSADTWSENRARGFNSFPRYRRWCSIARTNVWCCSVISEAVNEPEIIYWSITWLSACHPSLGVNERNKQAKFQAGWTLAFWQTKLILK